MRRRGCLIAVIGVLTLCLVGCGLVYFVFIPRVRDNAKDGVRDAIGTQVALQIPAGIDSTIEPGTYTLTAAELQNAMRDNVTINNVENIVLTISTEGLYLGLNSSGSDVNYTGLPVAENGQLVMTNMKSSEGYLDFIFPADSLGDAIEEAVNGYLATNNLQIETLELAPGEMRLTTVPTST